MIHVGALPGTPKNRFSIEQITENALKEATIFAEEGVDAIMIENMHDRPYLNRVKSVKNSVNIPVIIGSGIDTNNIHEFWETADAFIVGSWVKKMGNWENEVDRERVKILMQKINLLRK